MALPRGMALALPRRPRPAVRTSMGGAKVRRKKPKEPFVPKVFAHAHLFVKNLPKDATLEHVLRDFERVCAVKHVHVAKHNHSHKSRGFAFVTLVDPSQAQAACDELDGTVLRGEQLVSLISVAVARPPPSPLKAPELYVGNLPETATAEDVRQAFAGVCVVTDVQMPLFDSGAALGFAAVTLEEGSEVKRVRELMHGATIGDRQIFVEIPKVAVEDDLPAGFLPESPFDLNARLGSCSRTGDVLTIFEESGLTFDAINLATALHRIGVLARRNDQRLAAAAAAPLLQRLIDRTTASVVGDAEAWQAQGLANAVWGVAKLKRFDAPELFAAVAAEAVRKMGTFDAQALANIIWAYATAGVEAPELFRAVSAETVLKVTSFNAQELSITVWAYTKAEFHAPALYEAISLESAEQVFMFIPQNLANTVWAYAKAGVPAKALFLAVSKETKKHIGDFNAQHMANTVWAFAKAGVKLPSMFETISAQAVRKIGTFNAQELANTVWAFAKAGVSAPELFNAVSLEAPTKLPTFNAQNLANTAYAFAVADFEAPLLFKALAEESQAKIAAFEAQALANTAWAYATAKVKAPDLFAAVAAEAVQKIRKFNAQEL
ncbi:hypothetical protein M885DRAFT_242440 [Pelagophyceae sp. CCMP2097]|nr:hypothetical protein M885DRAFT_242440 [Pelagophyceae sp. CCMP2097]